MIKHESLINQGQPYNFDSKTRVPIPPTFSPRFLEGSMNSRRNFHNAIIIPASRRRRSVRQLLKRARIARNVGKKLIDPRELGKAAPKKEK